MDANALTDKLNRALLDLGDTPDTVAAYLEAQGCQGLKAQPGLCPVATYLTQALGAETIVGCVDVDVYRDAPNECLWNLPLPKPVRQFVKGFDGGKYPALEKKP